MKRFTIVVATLLTVSVTCFCQQQSWVELEKILGRKGTVQGDVCKFAFPRSDLKVKVGDIAIEPGLALTSWIAFEGTGDHTMMMGDLALLDAEIPPVVRTLVANNLEVSAIHNHIVGETPAIKYLHFGGHGNAATLAKGMIAVLSVTKTPLRQPPAATTPAAHDWSKVESILGRQGQNKGTVIQFGIPRAERITENGMEIPPFMGMAIGINLQSVGDKAATTGDFVLLANEVNPVVHALTEHGIAVTAIHSHMLFESPRLFFLHFWGVDTPEKLALGLKAALDKVSVQQKK